MGCRKHFPRMAGHAMSQNMTSTPVKEKRWIVLGEDGRHATLGRHSDPTDEEISRAAESLRAAGLGGWLAVTEGSYYARGKVSVLQVRELVRSSVLWPEAVTAFQAARAQTFSEHSRYDTASKAEAGS